MKSLFILFICCSFFIVNLKAASVTTAVEKLQKDSSDDNVTEDSMAVKDAVAKDCQQPKETGRCFALFYRFAYDMKTGKCEEFVYGGCAGNSNNFATKEACEERCLIKADDNATEASISTTIIPDSSSDNSKSHMS
uniref:BPTI/Kunitz inhibitor domain-containing protein n=1 Tax=Glossina austeni TaxID=7395 RepID=A0A1A9V0W5_GLOAU